MRSVRVVEVVEESMLAKVVEAASRQQPHPVALMLPPRHGTCELVKVNASIGPSSLFPSFTTISTIRAGRQASPWNQRHEAACAEGARQVPQWLPAVQEKAS